MESLRFFRGAWRSDRIAKQLTASSLVAIVPAVMAQEEDWLFRPVMRGLIRGESLLDGAVDLEYVALLNEAIDVERENQMRSRKAET